MSIESGAGFRQSDEEADRRRDFMREHNPVSASTYYEEKLAEIYAGKLTWVVRDLQEEYGRIYEIWHHGEYLGTLDSTKGMDVFGRIEPQKDGAAGFSVPGSFFEVLDKLEAYVRARYGEDVVEAEV